VRILGRGAIKWALRGRLSQGYWNEHAPKTKSVRFCSCAIREDALSLLRSKEIPLVQPAEAKRDVPAGTAPSLAAKPKCLHLARPVT
jgi:hypothetical protein